MNECSVFVDVADVADVAAVAVLKTYLPKRCCMLLGWLEKS